MYLPHFRAVVEAGVAAVMSAYNSVNGEWCGQNRELLTGILRDEWGFTGFVVSDFIWGLRDPVASLAAGLDIEMPFAQQRARTLPDALASGAASWADVDRAALRILATQLRFAAAVADPPPTRDVVACAAHRALARERRRPVDGAAAQRGRPSRSTRRACAASPWSAASPTCRTPATTDPPTCGRRTW